MNYYNVGKEILLDLADGSRLSLAQATNVKRAELIVNALNKPRLLKHEGYGHYENGNFEDFSIQPLTEGDKEAGFTEKKFYSIV